MGQSLVEFALVIPVFFLILGGVIQGGVLLWASNTLNQVVRDTGRYAATICGGSAVSSATTTFNNLYAASGGPWRNPSVTISYAAGTPGAPVCPDDNTQVSWVTVSATMQAFQFFPVIPGGGNVSSSTTFRVEPAP